MGSRTKIAVATIAAASVAVSASASEKERETPQVFKDAVACRDIADPAQRLACYDTAVGALATAEEQDDVVIASREEIRETRRGLFGLSLPKIKLFGGGDDEDKEEFRTLESTVSQVRSSGGRYSFVLEDGAVWQRTDNGFMKKPEPGAKITIRRAALGSFFAKIEDGIGFRVKRIQ